MALISQHVDDLDGTTPAAGKRYVVDHTSGKFIEVDLSQENLEEFDRFMVDYVKHGIVVGPLPTGTVKPAKTAKSAPRAAKPATDGGPTTHQIREWAETQPHLTVAPRGAIRADVKAAYLAAHPQG